MRPVRDPSRTGLTLALAAFLLLALQDATVKWLVQTVPVWQILFVRSVIVVMGCLAAGGRPLARQAIATPARALLLRRGVVTLTAWFCFFTAARGLPLGELVTLWFTAPMVVALLAAPLLGERVGRIRWIAIGIGFLGTVLIADPSTLSVSVSTVLVLFGAVCWGYGLVLTRLIARQEPSLVQMLFNNAFFLVATGIGCLMTWHPPTLTEALLLLVVALLGGFGQFSLFEAARRTPVSAIAPLEYTALVWAFIIGFLVWGDVPSAGVFTGASLIVGAGLLLVVAERKPKNARPILPFRDKGKAP
jgi:drug/metabolite transporter (DMT)-like permease